MFIEVTLTNNLIITMHLVTLLFGLVGGYVYTGLIYQDQDLVNHCILGNCLAFNTYVVLGAFVICVLGKCGELWRDLNVSRTRPLYRMSDLFTSLCCFAMGAGYAGGIYPDNNTYNKCMFGNILGWVSYGLFLMLITIRAYYVKRRANNTLTSYNTLEPNTVVNNTIIPLNIEN